MPASCVPRWYLGMLPTRARAAPPQATRERCRWRAPRAAPRRPAARHALTPTVRVVAGDEPQHPVARRDAVHGAGAEHVEDLADHVPSARRGHDAAAVVGQA
jgi:hypothetical protein